MFCQLFPISLNINCSTSSVCNLYTVLAVYLCLFYPLAGKKQQSLTVLPPCWPIAGSYLGDKREGEGGRRGSPFSSA